MSGHPPHRAHAAAAPPTDRDGRPPTPTLPPTPGAARRRCRAAARPIPPGRLRPTELLAAFFTIAIVYLLAAAGAAIVHALGDWPIGSWVALHLAFVGGVSQLVLGAGQFFAGAYLATYPPRRALVRAQLLLWNAGTVLVAIGVPEAIRPATEVGGALLVAGLVAFVAGLRGLRGRSLQRAPWAVRWYEACAVFLGVGVVAGVAMATGRIWTLGNLLGAHMVLNLAGWFGTAIVGTLHTFFPSITGTQLRLPALLWPTYLAWVLGVAALATGYGLGQGAVVIVGWAALAAGAALLGTNLLSSLRAAPRPLSLSARLIAPAQGFLAAALALGLVGAATGGATLPPTAATRAAIAVLLLPGWLGLTVAGSLLHMLSVLVRVRDFTRPLPPARPRRDAPLVAVAVLGVAVLATARWGGFDGLGGGAGWALIAAYAALGGLVLLRAARALRVGAPRV